MRANLHTHGAERGELLDQFLAVGKIRVVRFVVAEVGVDRIERALLHGSVYMDFDVALSAREGRKEDKTIKAQRLQRTATLRLLYSESLKFGEGDNSQMPLRLASKRWQQRQSLS
jgi:hypothetical protein